jgi:hypothetical protein
MNLNNEIDLVCETLTANLGTFNNIVLSADGLLQLLDGIQFRGGSGYIPTLNSDTVAANILNSNSLDTDVITATTVNTVTLGVTGTGTIDGDCHVSGSTYTTDLHATNTVYAQSLQSDTLTLTGILSGSDITLTGTVSGDIISGSSGTFDSLGVTGALTAASIDGTSVTCDSNLTVGGNISCSTISVSTGDLTMTAGGIEILVGSLDMTLGGIELGVGNILLTAGNVTAPLGTVSASAGTFYSLTGTSSTLGNATCITVNSDSLTIAGLSSLNGDVTIGGVITSTGDATITGDVTLIGATQLDGAVTITGLTTAGDINCGVLTAAEVACPALLTQVETTATEAGTAAGTEAGTEAGTAAAEAAVSGPVSEATASAAEALASEGAAAGSASAAAGSATEAAGSAAFASEDAAAAATSASAAAGSATEAAGSAAFASEDAAAAASSEAACSTAATTAQEASAAATTSSGAAANSATSAAASAVTAGQSATSATASAGSATGEATAAAGSAAGAAASATASAASAVLAAGSAGNASSAASAAATSASNAASGVLSPALGKSQLVTSGAMGNQLTTDPNLSYVPASGTVSALLSLTAGTISTAALTVGGVAFKQPAISNLIDVAESSTPSNNQVLAYQSSSGKWVNQTLGAISMGGSPSIAACTDVSESGMTTGQVLTYNGSSSKWTNQNLPAGAVPSIAACSDVIETSLANGQVLVWNGSKWVNQTPGTVQRSVLTEVKGAVPSSSVNGPANVYFASFTSSGGVLSIDASFIVNSASQANCTFGLLIDGTQVDTVTEYTNVTGNNNWFSPPAFLTVINGIAAGSHTLQISIPSPCNVSGNGFCVYSITEVLNVNSFALGNYNALATLTDSGLTTPSSGQVLVYNGSKWVNQTPGTTQKRVVTEIHGNTTSATITGPSSVAYPGTFTSSGGSLVIECSYTMAINTANAFYTVGLLLDGTQIDSTTLYVSQGGNQTMTSFLTTVNTAATGSHTLTLSIPTNSTVNGGNTCVYLVTELINTNLFTLGNYNALATLTDSSLTAPTNGQVLVYNGTTWANQTPGTTQKSTTTVISVIGPSGYSTGGQNMFATTYTSSGGALLIEATFSTYSAATTSAQFVLTVNGTNSSLVTWYYNNTGTTATMPTVAMTITCPAGAVALTINATTTNSSITIGSSNTCTYVITETANVNSFTLGNYNALATLTDASITSPSVNQVLTYNGSKWVNQAVQAAQSGNTVTGNLSVSGTIAAGSSNNVLGYNAARSGLAVIPTGSARTWLTLLDSSSGSAGSLQFATLNGTTATNAFEIYTNYTGTAATDYMGFYYDGANGSNYRRMFALFGNGQVTTTNCTLDDSSGNMTISGTFLGNNSMRVNGPSTTTVDWSTYGGLTPGIRWQLQDQGNWQDTLTLMRNPGGNNGTNAPVSVLSMATNGNITFSNTVISNQFQGTNSQGVYTDQYLNIHNPSGNSATNQWGVADSNGNNVFLVVNNGSNGPVIVNNGNLTIPGGVVNKTRDVGSNYQLTTSDYFVHASSGSIFLPWNAPTGQTYFLATDVTAEISFSTNGTFNSSYNGQIVGMGKQSYSNPNGWTMTANFNYILIHDGNNKWFCNSGTG